MIAALGIAQPPFLDHRVPVGVGFLLVGLTRLQIPRELGLIVSALSEGGRRGWRQAGSQHEQDHARKTAWHGPACQRFLPIRLGKKTRRKGCASNVDCGTETVSGWTAPAERGKRAG